MTSTLTNLHFDLDDAIPHCLRRIADYHEEQGDLRMAKAWRWIAENRYLPEIVRSTSESQWYACLSSGMNLSNNIPNFLIADTDIDPGFYQFPTQSEAYCWLAELVAKWQDSQTKEPA